MIRRTVLGLMCMVGVAGLVACSSPQSMAASQGMASPQGMAPPPEGWANDAPTMVEQVVDRAETQLLLVSQGDLRTWVRVPRVGASIGDYVLLGQGSVRRDVEIPEIGQRVREMVDISHVRVVDFETARQEVRSVSPRDAISIGTVYAELGERAGREVVVHGTVVKAPQAIGWRWVHLQDGSGDASSGTHDLTVKTREPVTVGQRVAFRGTLHEDVDLGFGYHYDALVEGGVRVDRARVDAP